MQTTQNQSQDKSPAPNPDQSQRHSDSILAIEQLSCERGERLLLQDFDLSLAAGEGVRIAGPNGSGKTTLLRIIAGLSYNYSGQLYWRGDVIQSPAVRNRVMTREVLFIGHAPGIKALLTPLENLSWWAAIHMPQRLVEADLERALAQVGLAPFARTPSFQLSAGQQRRVALARLYLSEHTLWILDEPFTAIDSDGVAQLEQRIAAHLAAGNLAIVTTHQPMQINGFRECAISEPLARQGLV